MSFTEHIESITAHNTNFRTVVHTGQKSQLVVMSIPPQGEIGEETHEHVEQTLYIQSGRATVTLDGVVTELHDGGIVVVTPGTRHNIQNSGETDLKIWTVYAPPNHIDARVHVTKEDADADLDDEAFGHQYTA